MSSLLNSIISEPPFEVNITLMRVALCCSHLWSIMTATGTFTLTMTLPHNFFLVAALRCLLVKNLKIHVIYVIFLWISLLFLSLSFIVRSTSIARSFFCQCIRVLLILKFELLTIFNRYILVTIQLLYHSTRLL